MDRARVCYSEEPILSFGLLTTGLFRFPEDAATRVFWYGSSLTASYAYITRLLLGCKLVRTCFMSCSRHV